MSENIFEVSDQSEIKVMKIHIIFAAKQIV